jgi:ERCC4-related helicase
MFNLVVFESGLVVRADLIQMMIPSFTVKYHNELIVPSVEDDTIFGVREVFSINVAWEAHIENFEDPKSVGNVECKIENVIDLKKYLKMLPEPILEVDETLLNKKRVKLRNIHNSYLEQLASNNMVVTTELAMEYQARANNFVKFVSKSKTDDTLNIIDSTVREVGKFEELSELAEFMNENYGVELSKSDKMSLLSSFPILQEDGQDDNQDFASENIPEEPYPLTMDDNQVSEDSEEPVSDEA